MKTKFLFNRKYSGLRGDETIQQSVTMSQLKKFIYALKHPDYSHARCRSLCGVFITSIYHRNRTSPSGCLQASALADEIASPLIRKYRNNSPLSPTEGLGGGFGALHNS